MARPLTTGKYKTREELLENIARLLSEGHTKERTAQITEVSIWTLNYLAQEITGRPKSNTKGRPKSIGIFETREELEEAVLEKHTLGWSCQRIGNTLGVHRAVADRIIKISTSP